MIVKVFQLFGENFECLLCVGYHNALNCPFDKTPCKNALTDTILISLTLFPLILQNSKITE